MGRIAVCVVVLAALTGCAGGGSTVSPTAATPQAVAAVTPTAPAPTWTPTVLPSAAPISTSTSLPPTFTPTPTSTRLTPTFTSTSPPVPTRTPAPTASRTAPSSPAPSAVATRQDKLLAAWMFWQVLGFEFGEAQAGRAVGTVSDGLASVELLGDAGELIGVSVAITVPTPPTKEQAGRVVVYLAGVLTTGAEEWQGGTEWLNGALNAMGESRTEFEGGEAVLVVTPGERETRVSLSVQAR